MTDVIETRWERALQPYQQLVVAHLAAQRRYEISHRDFLGAVESAQYTRAFIEAERASREAAARARAALREEVRTTVLILRGHELPPERVLRLVREALRESCVTHAGSSRYAHDEVMRLSSDVGQWVIEDYFAA